VLGSAEARHALAADPAVAEVIDCWNDLTIAVSGIGPLGPQDLAREYGHIFGADAFSMPSADEVVGDLCLRFFDERGALVPTAFDERLIGIAPEQLLRVERRIGVAGGLRKAEAIRGAILGDWINVLITDQLTAEHLLVLAAAP
jgi:DNA-binding transcriptional regulator LsrR (DeoR family)